MPISPFLYRTNPSNRYRPPDLLLGSNSYGVEIDLWSAGVTVAEMIVGKPILPGDIEYDQLLKTFRLLGTPTDETWPGVTTLPDYKADTFPQWPCKDFSEVFCNAGDDGVDFMRKTLVYQPTARMSAKRALEHPFLTSCCPERRYPQRRRVVWPKK